jgi:cytochrome b
MMLAQMSLVLAMAVTGRMQSLDVFWGAEWLLELNHDTKRYDATAIARR